MKSNALKRRKRDAKVSVLAKISKNLMTNGLFSKSERIVMESLSFIKKNKKTLSPINVVNKAVEKIEPPVKTVPKIIAGKLYRLPSYVAPDRSISSGAKWIIKAARSRIERISDSAKLGTEIISVYSGRSSAFKFRDDLVKLAKDNRPFIRYGGKKQKKRKKSF